MLEHPLHPMFVHFTIGLTVTSVFCYLLALIITHEKIRGDLFAASFWMLILSALATLITVTTGYLQFTTVAHDGVSHPAMVNHRYWGIGTASLIFALSIWFLIKYKKNDYTGKMFPILLLVLLGSVITTAYKGGNLVYKYGLGVQSTPEMRQKSTTNNKQRGSTPHGHEGHDHAH